MESELPQTPNFRDSKLVNNFFFFFQAELPPQAGFQTLRNVGILYINSSARVHPDTSLSSFALWSLVSINLYFLSIYLINKLVCTRGVVEDSFRNAEVQNSFTSFLSGIILNGKCDIWESGYEHRNSEEFECSKTINSFKKAEIETLISGDYFSIL